MELLQIETSDVGSEYKAVCWLKDDSRGLCCLQAHKADKNVHMTPLVFIYQLLFNYPPSPNFQKIQSPLFSPSTMLDITTIAVLHLL